MKSQSNSSSRLRAGAEQPQNKGKIHVETRAEVNAQDVEQGIKSLKAEIGRAPQVHVTNPWANRIPDASDLDPYAVPNQGKNKQQNKDSAQEGEVDFNDLFKGRKTQKEINDILQKYRNDPDKIKNFLKKAKDRAGDEAAAEQAKRMDAQLLHRKQMAVLTGVEPRPIVENPFAEYKQGLKNSQFTKRAQFARIIQRQEERELQAQAVRLSKERRVLMDIQQNTRQHANLDPILPQPFIRQKLELSRTLFTASRLCVLFAVSARYSQINASNRHIFDNTVRIQRQVRMFLAKIQYKRRIESAAEFQRILRRKQTQVQNLQRIQSLQQIREMLLRNYRQQTFLGTVFQMLQATQVIQKQATEHVKVQKVRCEFVEKQLTKADFSVCTRLCQIELCNQENKDKKRKKNEPLHKPEEYDPPQIMVTSKMLPEDEISILAPKVLEELQKKYFEQQVDLFEDNCNRSR